MVKRLNRDQKKHQYLKFLESDRYLDIVNYEQIICDDGHGVICMICYWHSNKYSVKKQEYDHDKFDNCMFHIKQDHTLEEIREYIDHEC